MSVDYEQMELDTRPKLMSALQDLTNGTIQEAQDMILENRRQIAAENGAAPATVRNRHEAYGIAAEQYAKIAKAVKAIKDDTVNLLATLPDPNYDAADATSSIVNSTSEAAMILIRAAAEMRRTMHDLYKAETAEASRLTPLEEMAEAAFQEAEDFGDDEETEE